MEPNQKAQIYANSMAYIDMAIRDAETLWRKVLDAMKKTPNMVNWDDNKKIEHFYRDNKEFYKEFPIVCRYMITLGLYSTKAFARYLKIKSLDAQASEKTPNGNNEELWIRREADYVKYLWKYSKRGRYTESQLKEIWIQAYESLKSEFSSFRKNYKDIEDRINEENKQNKKQLTKEALLRIISTTPSTKNSEDEGVIAQKSTLEDDIVRKQRLKEVLQIKLTEQRKAKVLDEIKQSIAMVTDDKKN